MELGKGQGLEMGSGNPKGPLALSSAAKTHWLRMFSLTFIKNHQKTKCFSQYYYHRIFHNFALNCEVPRRIGGVAPSMTDPFLECIKEGNDMSKMQFPSSNRLGISNTKYLVRNPV